MTPQFQQHAQHTELENVLRIIPALVGVTLLMGLFAPAALASPADCQAVDLSRSGAIESLTSWKDTSVTPHLNRSARSLACSVSGGRTPLEKHPFQPRDREWEYLLESVISQKYCGQSSHGQICRQGFSEIYHSGHEGTGVALQWKETGPPSTNDAAGDYHHSAR